MAACGLSHWCCDTIGEAAVLSHYLFSNPLLFPQTLMLVSTTTRPLLGCLWNFPSAYSGLAYATTSLVIHETVPIILMVVTNLTSLCKLYSHGQRSGKDAPAFKRVPAEKRAAKVRKEEDGRSLKQSVTSGCTNALP